MATRFTNATTVDVGRCNEFRPQHIDEIRFVWTALAHVGWLIAKIDGGTASEHPEQRDARSECEQVGLFWSHERG